jgi:glycosyltransferase involved in cell wall biosynthesis
MKILVFTADEFMNHRTYREMSKYWRGWGHDVYQYSLADHPNDDYLFKIRHYQMYEGFLDYAEKTRPDIVWFDNLLSVPEYLLSELEVRPDFGKRIVFIFAYRESYKSKARANVIARLIDKPQVRFAILESFIGPEMIPPKNIIDAKLDFNKLKIIYDKVNEEPEVLRRDKTESRLKYGLPLGKFIVLFFGRMTHSKGIDLLVKAFDKLGPEYHLFVKAKPVYLDFDFDVEKELRHKPNITFIEEHTPQEELGYVYSACDIAAIPYRWTYTYGSSGIPMQAAMAGRPIIAPKAYPFDYFIDKFKLGYTCELDNIDSLVDAIQRIRADYDSVVKTAKFNDYVKCVTTYKQCARVIVEG